MSKPLFVYIALAALALIVFAIWPEIDLAVARITSITAEAFSAVTTSSALAAISSA